MTILGRTAKRPDGRRVFRLRFHSFHSGAIDRGTRNLTCEEREALAVRLAERGVTHSLTPEVPRG